MPMKPEYIDSVGETGIDPSLRKHSDILERLRSYQGRGFWPPTADAFCAEAANEIERLRTEIERLRAERDELELLAAFPQPRA